MKTTVLMVKKDNNINSNSNNNLNIKKNKVKILTKICKEK